MKKSIEYTTKNYIKRQLREPIYIVMVIVLLYMDFPFAILMLIIALLFKSQTITIFELDDGHFKVFHPYLLIGKKNKTYAWDDIDEIRIKKYGYGGYGSTPYLDLLFKDGTVKRHFYDSLEKDDFEGFSKAIIDKLGEDKFYVNLRN